MSRVPRIGGSFAPPLEAAKLKEYRELAEEADPQVKHAMNTLCDCVAAYHKAGKRKSKAGTPHPSGAGMIRGLHDDTVAELDQHVPWGEELDMFAKWFDSIPSAGKQKALRDAAHHLLWYGRELFLDREPMTTDQLETAAGE